MGQFTEFCFAGDSRRETIVCDYISGRSGGGANPYGRLLDAIRHSGERAEALKQARPQPSPGWMDYEDDYNIILERVIAFCERENADIFDLPRTQVVVGAMPVYVEPEVRMEGDFGEWAVKLCLARKPMLPQRADVAYVLLERAWHSDPYWRAYAPHHWDVRSQPMPQVRNPSQELRDDVDEAAADFLERYDRLNLQPPLLGDRDGDESE